MSDLHIGAQYTQIPLIKKDLERARSLNARINLNGDVFDLILVQDKKRFRMNALPERLFRAGDNLINESIRWAAEILGPYADLIDMIGVGNHDDAAAKHHSVDLVTILVDLLNSEHKTQISYGGYAGWLNYRFLMPVAQRCSYKIQYHHGAGGGSPVTKGMAAFQRASSWIENADCIWRGHLHTKNVDRSVIQALDNDGVVRHRDVLNVRSASYMYTYAQQSSSDALRHGRRANYAADWDMAPLPTGGVFLKLDFANNKPIKATAEV